MEFVMLAIGIYVKYKLYKNNREIFEMYKNKCEI